MKPIMKEATKFGTGSHIILDRISIGKNFFIFPEEAKWVLQDVLKRYQDIVTSQTEILLKDFFSKEEYDCIKETYQKEIKSIDKVIHKKFLANSYANLSEMTMKDIHVILNDIEDALPRKLRKKMIAMYYKSFN